MKKRFTAVPSITAATEGSEKLYKIIWECDQGTSDEPKWVKGTAYEYANSAEEARQTWIDENIRDTSRFGGCWAKEATDYEIKEYEDEMSQLVDNPFW